MPREHGAWAMLLQPFIGSLIALKAVAWPVAPALGCVVLAFLVREPLLVLARQKWVWRDPHAETAAARMQVIWQLAAIAICAGLLTFAWPLKALLGLGGAAGALTILAVTMTVHNRQREVWFQALSATGLSASGLAACLAVTGRVPSWGWSWWLLHAVHFWTGILVVHVRLQARIDAKRTPGVISLAVRGMSNQARVVQGLVALAGLVLIMWGQLYYGLALLMSCAVHLRDIAAAPTAEAIAMPMSTVGKRALVVSLVFTGLLIAGVWRA